MLRIGSCLVLASALFVGGSGCGKSGGGSTPESAFNNMAEAAKKDDIRGFMSNMTKDSQKFMVGSMVVTAAGMKQASAFIKMDTKEIEAVLSKHGVDDAEVMVKLKSIKGRDADADAVAGAGELASMVKDGPGFVADINEAMKKMGKGKESSPAQDFKGNKLSDVKIAGEKATGKIEKDGKTQDIHFAKEDGAWKIDIVPMIEAQMKDGAK